MTWFPSSLHGETVVVRSVTLGSPDSSGVPAETVTETPWAGCNVQPVGVTESVGSAQVVTGRFRVSGPPASWITAQDQLIHRGITLRIEGDPRTFIGGAIDHTELIATTQRG